MLRLQNSGMPSTAMQWGRYAERGMSERLQKPECEDDGGHNTDKSTDGGFLFP